MILSRSFSTYGTEIISIRIPVGKILESDILKKMYNAVIHYKIKEAVAESIKDSHISTKYNQRDILIKLSKSQENFSIMEKMKENIN